MPTRSVGTQVLISVDIQALLPKPGELWGRALRCWDAEGDAEARRDVACSVSLGGELITKIAEDLERGVWTRHGIQTSLGRITAYHVRSGKGMKGQARK